MLPSACKRSRGVADYLVHGDLSVRAIWVKAILVSVAALSLCAIASGEALASKAYDRGDWMMGVSIGFGRGSWTNSLGERTTVTEGISPQWRVGKMLGSHWALGFEYSGWLIEDGDGGAITALLPSDY